MKPLAPFRLCRFKSVGSTNTLARQLANDGAGEGLVLTAEYQSEGRGKPGRTWLSTKGQNLLFSLLLRPAISPAKAPHLTQIACRSVSAVLKREYEIASTFKRPNDVMVQGRKICGVLTESSSGSNGKLDHVVIGIGLNVNESPSELGPKAICLREVLGKKVKPLSMLNKILRQLRKDLQSFYDRYSS